MYNRGFDGLGAREVWLVPLGQHQRLFSIDLHHDFAVSAEKSPKLLQTAVFLCVTREE